MSWAASAWAKQCRTGGPTSKAVLMALADYADEANQCFPGQERLAWECEVSVRTVRDTIKGLENDGFLTRERRYVGGTRTSDRYTLHVESRKAVEQAPFTVPADPAGKADLTGSPASSSPATGCRVTPSRTTSTTNSDSSLQSAVPYPSARITYGSAEPETHPSRGIRHDWLPSPEFRANLVRLYPEVEMRESHRRFVDYHVAKQDTSRSWEAAFRAWVSRDSEQILERRGGTDDMGTPRTQRKVADTLDPEVVRQQQEDLIDLAVRSARQKREQPDE